MHIMSNEKWADKKGPMGDPPAHDGLGSHSCRQEPIEPPFLGLLMFLSQSIMIYPYSLFSQTSTKLFLIQPSFWHCPCYSLYSAALESIRCGFFLLFPLALFLFNKLFTVLFRAYECDDCVIMFSLPYQCRENTQIGVDPITDCSSRQ